ncbi:MAG: adenosylcobinamide-GDP ribazoletransferase [Clostridia bacterium]
MDIISSFVICLSMYSIIPMPMTEWTDKKMRYCFLFLPFVGVIISAFWFLAFVMVYNFSLNFMAIILILVPVFVSGGIHIDGLIDTCDAIFSYGSKEKKLEILKDPRTGAFGVIGAIVYFLLMYATYSEVLKNAYSWNNFLPFIAVGLTFVMSRAIGALTMLSVPKARKNGLGATFSGASSQKINKIVLAIWIIISLAIYALISWQVCLAIIFVMAVFLCFFVSTIKKEFGGITGDLTGFIISVTELLLPLTMLVTLNLI